MTLWIAWGCCGLLAALLLCLLRARRRQRAVLQDILEVLREMEQGSGAEKRKLFARGEGLTAEICYSVNAVTGRLTGRIDALRHSQREYRKILAGLSHDLRTPLASLMGYLEAVDSGLVQGEEREEYLRVARDKARQLQDRMDALFSWFKLDSGEQSFQMEEADLCELTRDILTDWVPVWEREALSFTVEIPEGELPCRIDREAYRRIVGNLLQNVLEHSGADRVWLALEPKGDCVRLQVADNGRGVEEKDLPRLFDRLYMADPARGGGGSGLGLAIVRELAAQMGGSASAQSIPRHKTVFTVFLPLGRPPRQEK